MYVADRTNNLIQKFTTSGTFVSQWSVSSPQDVKVNANGTIWVVSNPDGGPKTVQIFTPGGIFLSTFLTLDDARQVAFDATTINTATVHFGATGTEATTTNFSTGDVNEDGLVDMTFVYHVRGTGITCSTTSVTITGQTTAGQSFSGTAPITTVGCH